MQGSKFRVRRKKEMQVKSMEKINLMLNPQPSEKLKSEYESLNSTVTQQRLHSRGSHDDEH